MKQKLAIARALLGRPALVFLDEPTAGLDPVAAAALREDLLRLVRGQGVTVFLTTHNLAEAERVCDRVAVIRSGRLLAVDTPARLRAGTGGQRVEISGRGLDEQTLDLLRAQSSVVAVQGGDGRLSLELLPGADVAPLVALLVARGVAIEEVRQGAASLEEAFMALLNEVEGQ